jgi:hypothetical protein
MTFDLCQMFAVPALAAASEPRIQAPDMDDPSDFGDFDQDALSTALVRAAPFDRLALPHDWSY